MAISEETRQKMRFAALNRSPEAEAKRIAASRANSYKISAALKGRAPPKNFEQTQRLAWAASRKDVLSYSGIHGWVRRNWKPATHCEVCGLQNLSGQKVHWANLDHKYSRQRSDWKMMCRPCHSAHDRDHNAVDFSSVTNRDRTHCKRGHEYTPETVRVYNGCKSCLLCKTERFKETYVPRERAKKTHCKRGHEFTNENTFLVRDGSRECRICRNERVKLWKLEHKGQRCPS